MFDNLKNKRELSEVAKCVDCLKSMTEGYAAGIDWKSNGLANDQYFSSIAVILPDLNLDVEDPIMFHLKNHLDSMVNLVGVCDFDIELLTYPGIMRYIRNHQDVLAGSTHTYRVILDLLNMAYPK